MIPFSLSARELQVASLLQEGKSNKEIALQLGIAIRTVEFHITHILEKLGVSSRAEAIVRLSETNLRVPASDSEDNLRESAVENETDLVQNEDKSSSNRRPSMKKWLLAVIIGLIVLCVFLCVFLLMWNYSPVRSSSPAGGSALPRVENPSGIEYIAPMNFEPSRMSCGLGFGDVSL